MRGLGILLALCLAPAVAGARGLDWCAAARAEAPAASQQGLALEEHARAMGERLERAIDAWSEVVPVVSRRAARRLFYAAVAPWLEASGKICRCLAEEGLPSDACAGLQARRTRACEHLPRGRPLDVLCLTKGR